MPYGRPFYSDTGTIRPLLLHNNCSSSWLKMPYAYSRAPPKKSHSTTLQSTSHVRSKVLTAPSTLVLKCVPSSISFSSPSFALHYIGYADFCVHHYRFAYSREFLVEEDCICSPKITKVDVGHAVHSGQSISACQPFATKSLLFWTEEDSMVC